MDLKQATLVALVGTWIALVLHVTQFAVYFDSYTHMGMGRMLLNVVSVLLGDVSILVFLTVLYKKQLGS